MIKQYLISGCYVMRDGLITPYGTIKILDPDYESKLPDWAMGLELYSPDLHRYAKGGHYAQISGRHVAILTKGTGVLVTKLTRKRMMAVEACMDNHRVRVMPNGYLLEIEGSAYGKMTFKSTLEALNDVARGIKPKHFDNTPYTRVDPNLAGQILICLQLEESRNDRVFTEKGVRVPSRTHAPLSFKRWGQPLPQPLGGYLPALGLDDDPTGMPIY